MAREAIDTLAIMLDHIDYTDNSVIARIYTREYGLVSCIAKGVKKKLKKGTNKMSYFLPLNICQVTFYYRAERELHLLSELHLIYYHQSLHTEIKKILYTSSLGEFLLCILHEDSQPHLLFDFLKDKIIQLDRQNEHLIHLYVHILLNVCAYLGYKPNVLAWQDILETDYQHLPTYLEDVYYNPEQSYPLTTEERKAILAAIEQFAKRYIHGFKPLQSKAIWEIIY